MTDERMTARSSVIAYNARVTARPSYARAEQTQRAAVEPTPFQRIGIGWHLSD